MAAAALPSFRPEGYERFESAPACHACGAAFSLFANRRRHCRACFHSFCIQHASRMSALPDFSRPVRVCDACYVREVNSANPGRSEEAAAVRAHTLLHQMEAEVAEAEEVLGSDGDGRAAAAAAALDHIVAQLDALAAANDSVKERRRAVVKRAMGALAAAERAVQGPPPAFESAEDALARQLDELEARVGPAEDVAEAQAVWSALERLLGELDALPAGAARRKELTRRCSALLDGPADAALRAARRTAAARQAALRVEELWMDLQALQIQTAEVRAEDAAALGLVSQALGHVERGLEREAALEEAPQARIAELLGGPVAELRRRLTPDPLAPVARRCDELEGELAALRARVEGPTPDDPALGTEAQRVVVLLEQQLEALDALAAPGAAANDAARRKELVRRCNELLDGEADALVRRLVPAPAESPPPALEAAAAAPAPPYEPPAQLRPGALVVPLEGWTPLEGERATLFFVRHEELVGHLVAGGSPGDAGLFADSPELTSHAGFRFSGRQQVEQQLQRFSAFLRRHRLQPEAHAGAPAMEHLGEGLVRTQRDLTDGQRTLKQLVWWTPEGRALHLAHHDSHTSTLGVVPRELEDDHKLCIVCLDEERGGYFDPCGHVCCCMGCAEQLLGLGQPCPLCRKGCRRAVRVYL